MKTRISKYVLFFCIAFSCLVCNPPIQRIELYETVQEMYRYHPERSPIVSAHRGGPVNGYPENCIETFENTLRRSCSIIECDIRKTKDNHLIMMHDHTLDRTTTGQGNVEDHALDEIRKLYLKDHQGNVTKYRVPTLEEALLWADGKVFLSLDVKQDIDYDTLISIIRRHKAQNRVNIITYSATEAGLIYQKDSSLMLSASIRKIEDLVRLREYGVPVKNYSAYVGNSEPDQKLVDTLHSLGVSCIFGTMGNLDKKAEVRGDMIYYDLLEKGADILATDRYPEAEAVIRRFAQVRNLRPRCRTD